LGQSGVSLPIIVEKRWPAEDGGAMVPSLRGATEALGDAPSRLAQIGALERLAFECASLQPPNCHWITAVPKQSVEMDAPVAVAVSQIRQLRIIKSTQS
jgi:hypothetical protein